MKKEMKMKMKNENENCPKQRMRSKTYFNKNQTSGSYVTYYTWMESGT